MTGFCIFKNVTLLSPHSITDYIIAANPKEKKVVGLIGQCIDKMLGKMQDRKCNLVGEENFGVKLDNGTYTGALGLLQSGKGHLYLKGEPHFIDEDWLQKSLPLRSENIWSSQVINDENKFDFFDLLENFKFSLEIYLTYFLTFLLFGLICFYLIRLNLSKNRNYLQQKNGLKFICFIRYLFISRKFKFKLILLFLGLFSWFSLLFLANTIKTNKVVVDTSELVKDKDELIKSDLVCFLKDDTAYNLALNSPKKSLLFRLFDEKTKLKDDLHRNEKNLLKIENCFLHRFINHLKMLEKDAKLILTQIETMAFLLSLSSLNLLKKAFILSKGIQEYNAVLYYAKYRLTYSVYIKLDDYLRFLHKFFYKINEHGISIDLYDCMESNAESIYSKTMKVYKELHEYIEDNTGSFADLELNNFSSLFIIYFGFLTIIFIIFFIFQILPFYYSKFIDKFYQFVWHRMNFYLSIRTIIRSFEI